MTLHIVKTYTLTCDGCGDVHAPTPGTNPRPAALAAGWRNGRYTTMPRANRQERLDLCPACIAEGVYIRHGVVRENRLGRRIGTVILSNISSDA